jgi:hypothetical protein
MSGSDRELHQLRFRLDEPGPFCVCLFDGASKIKIAIPRKRRGRPLPAPAAEKLATPSADLTNEDRANSEALCPFQPAYLSALDTLPKVAFRFVSRPCTTAIIATEMPAVMSPYSMAVAAVSSLRKQHKPLHCRLLLLPHGRPPISKVGGTLQQSCSHRLLYC